MHVPKSVELFQNRRVTHMQASGDCCAFGIKTLYDILRFRAEAVHEYVEVLSLLDSRKVEQTQWSMNYRIGRRKGGRKERILILDIMEEKSQR